MQSSEQPFVLKEGLQGQDAKNIAQGALERINAEIREPLRVAIMGQTGVGKSSLLNALFNTNLPTDPIQPCTKEITPFSVGGSFGNQLLFYDLPGLGEAEEPDAKYLTGYREMLLKSDVVLWAIHADNRSVTFDIQALRQILMPFDRAEQAKLMSKITLVLTKVDLLTPSPWYLVKRGKSGTFVSDEETEQMLKKKAAYFQKAFIDPYADLITSQTYNKENFNISLPHFSSDEHSVYYQGLLDESMLNGFKQTYPQYASVFNRLYDNYRVMFCSSLFRFNLSHLMLVIINKLGQEAVFRFDTFIKSKGSEMNLVPFAKAKSHRNIVVVNEQGHVLFDLAERA